MQGNFYGYQQRRFLLLLCWGLLSVITGFVLQRSPKSFWQQFGIQALLWGVIDAALALFGLTSANKKEERYALGELGTTDEQKEARTFYRILLINAGLDVGYVALGAWLMQRFNARSDRRGMGLGILIQGLWLFLFDGLVSQEVRGRWRV
ncbi:MAG: hypothetical protein PVS3B3_11920 [Ktedonobacteraceae bacterium]